MEFFMQIVNTYGLEIIGTILTALAGTVAMALKKLATRYVNNKIMREIARTVVQGVEQLYKGMSGEEKLGKALEAAAEMLAAQGITVTDLELRMLLEAAVGEFNDVFHSAVILEGIDVDDLDDDQLRDVLQQMGQEPAEGATREELEAMLDAAGIEVGPLI